MSQGASLLSTDGFLIQRDVVDAATVAVLERAVHHAFGRHRSRAGLRHVLRDFAEVERPLAPRPHDFRERTSRSGRLWPLVPHARRRSRPGPGRAARGHGGGADPYRRLSNRERPPARHSRIASPRTPVTPRRPRLARRSRARRMHRSWRRRRRVSLAAAPRIRRGFGPDAQTGPSPRIHRPRVEDPPRRFAVVRRLTSAVDERASPELVLDRPALYAHAAQHGFPAEEALEPRVRSLDAHRRASDDLPRERALRTRPWGARARPDPGAVIR